MANLKVFLSSTCYDLRVVRSQLRNFILSVGYEPVMSEYSDMLFDPRLHTHTSCLQEVANCDMVVLIVGTRYGGDAIPNALEEIDLEKVKNASTASLPANQDNNFSVTQLEVFQAIQMNIPMFTFVDESVLHDHRTYEKNKHKSILDQIEFPSIEKQDTAGYIFEFINFLRLRAENNSVVGFSKLEDIETHLRKQWSALLQRLLYEQKTRELEEQRIDNLTSQIADLKTAVMTSITSNDLKETAKGAIKFRSLIDFISGLNDGSIDVHELLLSDKTWENILETFSVVDVRPDNFRPDNFRPDGSRRFNNTTLMIRADGTYYQLRMPLSSISVYASRWFEFRQLAGETRNAIINAVLDNADTRPLRTVRYVPEQFDESLGEPTLTQDTSKEGAS